MEKRIENLLRELGYFDLELIEEEGNVYYYEGYSDAEVEIKVEVKGDEVEVYDRYLAGEKHFVHQGNHILD